MIRSLSLVFLFCLSAVASGQTIIRPPIFRKDVDSLQKLLTGNIADTIRIDILLKLAEFNFQKAGDVPSDLDSAATFISNAKEINSKQISRKRDGVILLYESSLARGRGNPDEGRRLANMAITQLQTAHDDIHLVLAYLELSRCYDANKPDEAIEIRNVYKTLFQRVPALISAEQLDACMAEIFTFYFLRMRNDNPTIRLDFLDHLVATYRVLNDKLNEFWARKEIADVHHLQGKLELAINELLQIAKEQKDGGYPRICFTYDLLSGVYIAATDYNKALYYSLEAVKNVKTDLDSAYLSIFIAKVAANYSRTGSLDEAVDWNLKRLNYLIAIKKTNAIFNLVFDITSDMIKLGRKREALNMILEKRNSFIPSDNWEKRCLLLSLAQCYAALKNKTMAERYCGELIEVMELRVKQNETPVDMIGHQFLGDFYIDAGQLSKAEKYFKNTSPLYRSRFLFRLDSAKGKYLSAIKHLQDYQFIKDSIFTIAKSNQIEQLKVVYATEQKDQLLKANEQNILLLTREDQLQKSKLRQGLIIRNISFAVVGLLVIIMALLYNRYRLKQRTNRKLELQQQEIAKQNSTLQHLLNEKDWLLKEIHHRVKNNLQIVMSLLSSQSAYIENEPALTAIHDSQHRVHAMSLIHQKLYNTENVSSISMEFYIRELVSYLSDSFDTGQRIRFEMDIEPVEMDVSQAIPLGLILNEAITNSIKYAFPYNKSGTISISLAAIGTDRYLLTVSDNGIGIHADHTKTGSLGMSLMKGLSEDLDGNFSIENNNGTVVKISFVKNTDLKRAESVTSSFVSNN